MYSTHFILGAQRVNVVASELGMARTVLADSSCRNFAEANIAHTLVGFKTGVHG